MLSTPVGWNERATRCDAPEADLDLQARVSNVLHWSLAIPRHAVDVQVDGGCVTLRGVVAKAYEKSCAEALARRVPGVAGVRNEIHVRPDADGNGERRRT